MDILSNFNLVSYINYVKNLPYDQKIIFLTTNHPEWETNKILFDYYNTSTDIALADGDLLRLIEAHRIGNIPRSGLDTFDPTEIGFLMKAWKSQLYHRFMCHVLGRYLSKDANPHPIFEDGELHECCVCWRGLKGSNPNNASSHKHENDMKDIAFTVDGTKTVICKNCLMNLFRFGQLMTLLEDKDFNSLIRK